MKAIRQYRNLTIEVEARDQVDLFKQLAAMDDVFGDLEAAAEIDGDIFTSDDVAFVVRTDNEENDYFEVVCKSGPLQWYKRRLGQHKKGNTLFSRATPPPTEQPGLRGWSKYVKDAPSRPSQSNDAF